MTEPNPGTKNSPPGVPRWVKLLGAVGAVIVVVVVVVMILVGGEHSPQRHLGGAGPEAAEHTPPPGVTHGEQP